MHQEITTDEQRELFEKFQNHYRSMFADMDDFARAAWFISMDESAILSFTVESGETVEQAAERHNIKVLAIAAALEELPCAEIEKNNIAILRSMALTSMAKARERQSMLKEQAEGVEPASALNYKSIDIDSFMTQIYKEVALENLTKLGMLWRIEGTDVQEDEWLPLLKLSLRVAECASQMPPTRTGGSVYIDKTLGAPNARGDITTSSNLDRPYWIPKADLYKLWELEEALDSLKPHTQH